MTTVSVIGGSGVVPIAGALTVESARLAAAL